MRYALRHYCLFASGKHLMCCATYAAVLQKRSIKVVEKLGKKNRVYVAVLREPQHITQEPQHIMCYVLRFFENRSIYSIFFFLIKSRLHSFSTFKTPENILFVFKMRLHSQNTFIQLISLFIFFNPLLQPMKICCSSSSSSSIFSFFKTHENFCSSSSSKLTQFFRASFFKV